MAQKIKSVEVKGRTWTQDDIKELLRTNDRAVVRALLIIYGYQTDSEKASGETKFDNGIGFNGVDAYILTSFAQQVNNRGFLSPKQMGIARKKMLKYSGQILKHMSLQAV